jgi:hypothetical protein
MTRSAVEGDQQLVAGNPAPNQPASSVSPPWPSDFSVNMHDAKNGTANPSGAAESLFETSA